MSRTLRYPGASQSAPQKTPYQGLAVDGYGKPRTLLVDGNYLLKNSVTATEKNPEYVVNGRHMGGVAQFLRKLHNLVRDYYITKCVVMWDGEAGGILRYNIYPYYKANRKSKSWYAGPRLTEAQVREQAESQRSIAAQRIRVKNYLENLFVRQVDEEMMEGDDLIAYYCQQHCQDEDILIYTDDSDICQLLVCDNVRVYLQRVKMVITQDNFNTVFPWHYANTGVVKIFCGDTSDNIKGIKGVGLKTLLNLFPELKERPCKVNELLKRAAELAKQKGGSQAALANILKGVSMRKGWGGEETAHEFGKEIYKLNHTLMDLTTPMLSREARESVDQAASSVLDPSDRTSLRILEMLQQDYLLRAYGGTVNQFANPFYPLIKREQSLWKEYQEAYG
jgi:5'-3' exonuclease